MIGAIVVTDYREFESWKKARFAVCAVLDFTKSLSGFAEHRRLARDIDHLSMSILDTLARGFEKGEGVVFLDRALASVDRLERVLQRASERQAVPGMTTQRLQRELRSVRRAIQKKAKMI